MKSFNKRIDDLGAHLSPIEIVLRWLRARARMRSTSEYAASLKDSGSPLKRMTRQARRAVEKSMKGMPSDAIERHVREAVRRVAFLWHLHLQANSRISDELRVVPTQAALLVSELHSRFLDDCRRSDAARAWLRTSRDFPYPLDAQTAAAVEAALPHQVESWSSFRDAGTIDEWMYEDLGGEDDDEVSEDSAARIARRVEREIRRLVRSNEIEPGKVVSLLDSPHPFLSSAPLLEGRWIDVIALELAELGVILAGSGCTLRGSSDWHSLAWEEFCRTDAKGELAPIDDASWHDAREAAGDRVQSYRGRRRVFSGRDYVECALYQRWRARSLCARLDVSASNGFVVASWNDWVNNQGLKAVLAGIRVEPIDPLAVAGTWTVHDSRSARRLQAGRTNHFSELRSVALREETSTESRGARDQTDLPWRDGAAHVLSQIEGLAAAVEGIRSKYFGKSEIVFTELVECLDYFRANLREILKTFESQRQWADPLLGCLGFHSLPDDRETADTEHGKSLLEQIKSRIVQSGERIAEEIIRDARFDALVSVGEKDAARRIIDEELDEFLS